MPNYQIINCEQGAPEWYKARLGNATASCFGKIITSTGKRSTSLNDYAFQLASELLTIEQDPFYRNEAMERGNELEDDARIAYREYKILPAEVDQVGFLLCDGYGYSPDGLVDIPGQIEIKCPSQKVHTKYLYNQKLPTEYKQQVQGGLYVSEREWCDFVSYHPQFKDYRDIFVHRVYRDEKFIKELAILIKEVTERKLEILNKIRSGR